MFVQGDATSSTQSSLGIGLTLARSLVELHGGRLEANSLGPGHGSEFVIRLPLAAASTGQVQKEQSAAVDRPATHAALPVDILIVDDNRDSADSLAILLRLQGYQVTVAYEGASALEAIAVHRPKAALIDLGMPGMDGYQLAARIRALPDANDIALIALTGWGQANARRRSAEAGFDRHLIKPVAFETLESVLKDLTSPRQAPSDLSET